MSMDVIKIVGSDETVVQVARVPCVGERVQTRGLSRKVIGVEHIPAPAPLIPWPVSDGPVSLTWTTQAPVAIVTVADE